MFITDHEFEPETGKRSGGKILCVHCNFPRSAHNPQEEPHDAVGESSDPKGAQS